MVSNLGRIRSLIYYHGTSSRILKYRFNSFGYPYVLLYKNKLSKRKFVHRLVLETFDSSCPKGMECCHNDGNKLNPNLNNLRWDTRSANRKDAFKHGTCNQCGTNNNNSKLTIDDVIEIRRLLYGGHLTQGEIGQLFGVANNTICYINRRKTWQHVQ